MAYRKTSPEQQTRKIPTGRQQLSELPLFLWAPAYHRKNQVDKLMDSVGDNKQKTTEIDPALLPPKVKEEYWGQKQAQKHLHSMRKRQNPFRLLGSLENFSKLQEVYSNKPTTPASRPTTSHFTGNPGTQASTPSSRPPTTSIGRVPSKPNTPAARPQAMSFGRRNLTLNGQPDSQQSKGASGSRRVPEVTVLEVHEKPPAETLAPAEDVNASPRTRALRSLKKVVDTYMTTKEMLNPPVHHLNVLQSIRIRQNLEKHSLSDLWHLTRRQVKSPTCPVKFLPALPKTLPYLFDINFISLIQVENNVNPDDLTKKMMESFRRGPRGTLSVHRENPERYLTMFNEIMADFQDNEDTLDPLSRGGNEDENQAIDVASLLQNIEDRKKGDDESSQGGGSEEDRMEGSNLDSLIASIIAPSATLVALPADNVEESGHKVEATSGVGGGDSKPVAVEKELPQDASSSGGSPEPIVEEK